MIFQRPPIVVVMGHVDHGKTTLLDYIRKTNVAGREAGGITQTIGAYEIHHNGKKITFIDTPGHEAFSKMRERGARAADLAILVVAADDGVQLQTKDAFNHIQKAGVPFVVAINKIDKPGADVEKVKQQLTEAGIFLEGYGGNISWQAISAKTGKGVNELLDLILLAAELENLTYDENGRPSGIILTARTDSRRGNIVTAIVENGAVRVGQMIATATAMGKIKSLENFLGEKIKELRPSAPAVIYGFETLPQVGEEFFAGSGKVGLIAEEITRRIVKDRAKILRAGPKDKDKEVKLILRADESGSLEALENIVEKLSNESPFIIVAADVGDIYEKEVKLAAGAEAIIVGFKVKIDKAAENLALGQNVQIITSDIIYDLEKILKEKFIKAPSFNGEGELEVLAVFGQRKGNRQIIGGRVSRGEIRKGDSFEIRKKEEDLPTGRGRILNLQSQKKDVSWVGTGQEVGLLVESDILIVVGDTLIFQ